MKNLLTFCLRVCCVAVQAQLLTYPEGLQTGMPHNDDYTVRVRVPGGDWKDLFEYNVQVDICLLYTSVISSETGKEPTACLWKPSDCHQLRAVMVGKHNMSEETLFEMPRLREALSRMGIGLVWICLLYTSRCV